MKLAQGIEALDGLPILYIKKLSAIVCSDLHLGYEGVMADQGVFMPKVNLQSITKIIKKAVVKTGAENIIIDGDIKNEFSKVHDEELNEFADLKKFLLDELKLKKIILIKGNHDNFINRVTSNPRLEVHEQEVSIDDFLFFHGEEMPKGEGNVLVMGHIHPSISFDSLIGAREKLRCFLYGEMKGGRELIVLPAMSFFASGISVNLENVERLAPVFKSQANLSRMEAFCIGSDETLSFGRVGELRSASIR